VNAATIISRRMVLFGAVVVLATWYIAGRISPGVSYARLAYGLDVARAADHADTLIELQRADPGFGTAGAEQTAWFIRAAADGLHAWSELGEIVALGDGQATVRLSVPTASGGESALQCGSVRFARSGDLWALVGPAGAGEVDAGLVWLPEDIVDGMEFGGRVVLKRQSGDLEVEGRPGRLGTPEQEG